MRMLPPTETQVAAAAVGGGLTWLAIKTAPFVASLAMAIFAPIGPWGSGGAPTGTASGDLGGTYPSPTVTATHLATALPVNQGGTAATVNTSSTAYAALGNGTLLQAGTVYVQSAKLATPLPASSGGTGTTTGTFSNACGYSGAQALAAPTGFAQIYFPTASTLVSQSNIATDIAGTGSGTFVAKACSDGTTCGAGNVYLTCTTGANCATAVAGRIDGCAVTRSDVAAGTTLTLGTSTNCGTTDPGVNVCASWSTP